MKITGFLIIEWGLDLLALIGAISSLWLVPKYGVGTSLEAYAFSFMVIICMLFAMARTYRILSNYWDSKVLK